MNCDCTNILTRPGPKGPANSWIGYWVSCRDWRADGSGRADGLYGTGSTDTGPTSRKVQFFRKRAF